MKLQCREHISNEYFQKLNWLPINQRFKQCDNSTVFKFVQSKCPAYMNEIFRPTENIRINIRNSYLKGCVRYIFASLFFKSKPEHLSNVEKYFLFHFKSSFRSQENQILEFYIECLSIKQEIHFTE